MKPENISFLDSHRPIHTMLVQAGIVKHLDAATRDGLLRVIHEEWDPGYLVNMWCAECMIKMIEYAYIQYDKYLSKL